MIFGEQEIRMNWIFPIFISPVISYLHQSESKINSFNFSDSFFTKISDFYIFAKCIISSVLISLIQAISRGFSVIIDDSQAFKLQFLSIIIGNEELFTKINEPFPPDSIPHNIESPSTNHKRRLTIGHDVQITDYKVPFDSVSFLEHVEFFLVSAKRSFATF